MFIKLRRKIFNSIFFVILGFVILLTAISFAIIAKNLTDSQKSRTVSNAESGVRSLSFYFSTAMGFVENSAKNAEVIDALSGTSASDVTPRLNELCDYAVTIDGVTLYGYNGYTAYSAGVGAPPSLENLKSVKEINDFILSESSTIVSVRNVAVCGTYHSNLYPSEKGIVSCISKVYDGKAAVGLIVADILPENLCKERLNSESFNSKSTTFIFGSELITDDQNFKEYFEKTKPFGTTKDGKYYLATAKSSSGFSVAVFAPKNNFRKRLIMLFAAFCLFDTAVILTGAAFSRFVSAKAVNPLDNLYNRMTSV